MSNDFITNYLDKSEGKAWNDREEKASTKPGRAKPTSRIQMSVRMSEQEYDEFKSLCEEYNDSHGNMVVRLMEAFRKQRAADTARRKKVEEFEKSLDGED